MHVVDICRAKKVQPERLEQLELLVRVDHRANEDRVVNRVFQVCPECRVSLGDRVRRVRRVYTVHKVHLVCQDHPVRLACKDSSENEVTTVHQ